MPEYLTPGVYVEEAGAWVHVILYADAGPLEAPIELEECLKNESEDVWKRFLNTPDFERRHYLDWIYSSKTEEMKAERILKLIDILTP